MRANRDVRAADPPSRVAIGAVLMTFALGAVAAVSPAADAPAGGAPTGTAAFIIVPLRVHVLTADDLPDVDCKLTDADVGRIVTKVNDVWHPAGIHFGLETIVRERAVIRGTFQRARTEQRWVPLPLYRLLRPEQSRQFDGLHVYYVHQMPVNGVYMGDDFAFVKETSELRRVDGGLGEPVPRVTAHELGHALGLEHRQDRINLMASGTTGTLLNEAEVAAARERAAATKGAMSVADAWAAAGEAERNGEREKARRLWAWLAGLPGGDAVAAKRKLDRFQPPTRPSAAAVPREPASPGRAETAGTVGTAATHEALHESD